MTLYMLYFEIQINQPVDVIYDHLREPYNYIGLQPLLTHVESVQPGEQDGKQTVSYDTVEAFRWLGVVLYRNRIRVKTVFTNPPYRFETMVHSVPNIVLNVGYDLLPQNGGTLLKETMQIRVYSWLSKFVLAQATQAQKALLTNLKERLEQIN